MRPEDPSPCLILASGSSSRSELLGRLGIPFEVVPADLDETPLADETPTELVERLSREKARVVARQHPEALVIGSDQVAVFEGTPTGKPLSAKSARSALRRFSGETVVFLTGVCLLRAFDRSESYHLDRTTVQFRSLNDAEIARYVERDDPLHCAGSFKVESLGPSLFESIDSTDPTALPGLPLIRLSEQLRAAGCPVP
ncbi:MAG: nucleoside triphosphate pyrophosphatase [Pseudomonadota bacterium]